MPPVFFRKWNGIKTGERNPLPTNFYCSVHAVTKGVRLKSPTCTEVLAYWKGRMYFGTAQLLPRTAFRHRIDTLPTLGEASGSGSPSRGRHDGRIVRQG